MEQTNPAEREGMAAVITDKRLALGLSQNRVADDSAIPRATFTRRLRRNDWSLDEIERIAAALNAAPSTLMAEAERDGRAA